jgi:hypothetical protein
MSYIGDRKGLKKLELVERSLLYLKVEAVSLRDSLHNVQNTKGVNHFQQLVNRHVALLEFHFFPPWLYSP